MNTFRTDLLDQAIAAARAGQRATARGLLQAVIADDPNNAQAWLWYSGAVDDPDEQAMALQRVLVIEPANSRAQSGLDWLREHHPDLPSFAPLIPLSQPAIDATTTVIPPLAPYAPPLAPKTHAPEPAVPEHDEQPITPERAASVDQTLPLYMSAALQAKTVTPLAPAEPERRVPIIDDDLRCPVCGSAADVDDTRCPQCEASLIVGEEAPIGAHIARYALALIAFGITIAAVAASFWLLDQPQGAPVAASGLAAWLATRGYPAAGPGLEDLVSAAGLGMLGLALVGLLLTVGLLRRSRIAYGVYLLLVIALVALLPLVLSAGLRLIDGILKLPFQLHAADILTLVGLLALILALTPPLLMAWRVFFPHRTRLRLTLDERSGAAHYRLARRYRARGWIWAAEQEYECAIAAAPHMLKYQRALAELYGDTSSYARAG